MEFGKQLILQIILLLGVEKKIQKKKQVKQKRKNLKKKKFFQPSLHQSASTGQSD